MASGVLTFAVWPMRLFLGNHFDSAVRQVSLPAAIWGGVTQTWLITRETFSGLTQMISGARGTDELGQFI